MACACKVNQHIDFLHKKYGEKQPYSKKTNIRPKMKRKLQNWALFLFILPFIPIILIFNLSKNISGGVMKIDKIFKLN